MREEKAKILIVDDELPIREVLSATLRDEGFQVKTAHDSESGMAAMREFSPAIVFLDIWMPGSLDGIEVLTMARKQFPDIEFVMISGHGTIETAVKATKLGAWDFIEKPLSMDKILINISNILQFQSERAEKEVLLNRLRHNIAIIGEHPSMVGLKQMLARLAPAQSWIFMHGEKGVGKNLFAQNIHYMSGRAGRPFVEVNGHHLPEDLLETELFGFEKGAFPGAEKTQKGKLELAAGGTLFLSDITELSLSSQDKLMKVLQEKKFSRKGSKEELPVDVRIIAATTQDPQVAIREGKLSQDLYHRLNMNTMQILALRERPEDIPSLVLFFSDSVASRMGVICKEISEQGMQALRTYPWPGNVLELKNFIERVYILTPSDFVDVHDLRFAGLTTEASTGGADFRTFREARAAFEKDFLAKKIQENSGNISRTAEIIGLERSYLHRKMKSYGLEANRDGDES